MSGVSSSSLTSGGNGVRNHLTDPASPFAQFVWQPLDLETAMKFDAIEARAAMEKGDSHASKRLVKDGRFFQIFKRFAEHDAAGDEEAEAAGGDSAQASPEVTSLSSSSNSSGSPRVSTPPVAGQSKQSVASKALNTVAKFFK